MLSQIFTPAISAQNLGLIFNNNLNFRQYISQTGRYLSFAVAKIIATVLVSLDYCNSLYHNIAFNDILTLQHVQNCLARVVLGLLISLHQYHFINHCFGSLYNIALFLISPQLPIKHFHPSNQHIYIHCSLLQDSPDSFDHLILIYFLFPCSVKTNVRIRAFSVAAPTLWNSLPVSVKSVGNMTYFAIN